MPRRNMDEESRRSARRASTGPDDRAALARVGRELLRVDPTVSFLPDPPAAIPAAFRDACDRAIHAGRSLREFVTRSGAKFVLQRPDLEVLSKGHHERLRLFTSYPGLGNAQLLAVAVATSDDPARRGTYAPASIVVMSPPNEVDQPQRSGGVARPIGILHVNDSASLLLSLSMRRILESGKWDETVEKIVEEGTLATVAAAGDTGTRPSQTGALADRVDSLSLGIRRAVHGLMPPTIERPSESNLLTPEQQEDLARSLVPAIAAGGELASWVEAHRGSGETYRWIVNLSGIFARGSMNQIPDSPAARESGAVGAIPLQWAMIGGRVVEAPGRRRHTGGVAAVAFLRDAPPVDGERRCGLVVGPAEDLLSDDLRWASVTNAPQEYFRAGGYEPL